MSQCEDGRGGVSRRQFVGLVGLGSAALAGGMPVMAGPFEAAEFEKLVPADKKLSRQWVESLFARGTRTVYRGRELAKIGMPIGGICAGQLYMGGDGRLWWWDIFNQHRGTGDAHYARPPSPDYPVAQGFTLRVASGGKTTDWPLAAGGFSEITFTGEYPIGYVEYRDPKCPIAVSLEAFSPFIPLDPDDSHLPATLLRFTLKNTSDAKVDCDLTGKLENAVGRETAGKFTVVRKNRIAGDSAMLLLECSADADPAAKFANQPDFGTMTLGLLGAGEKDAAAANVLKNTFGVSEAPAKPGSPPPVGSVTRRIVLEPGQSHTATFVVAWHFTNITHLKLSGIEGRRYGKRFKSAREVAQYIAANFEKLAAQTRLWHDTWYDSTLPYWFLDRTFLNTSILATSTAYWFGNGRFYGWEGVGCCTGTCCHVWHYAQAVARLFPSLERTTRETVDYGVSFHPATGVIGFRGEFDRNLAVDGQAGTILRAYREHQMSPDDAFLRRCWPRIRQSIECLIAHDPNRDGILAGAQMNTLDQPWFGKIAWLSSLYVAALRAGEQMALEAGDEPFARLAGKIAAAGTGNIDRQLFNGEYYCQVADPEKRDTVGSFDGCEIDQVLGQSWAFQVHLGRILPEENTKKALRSLWKYNFAPDVGPFRKTHPQGRWYAMAGEAGLLMCSWPKGEQARLRKGFDYYFNECMTGFEYQVAGHMLWEGMVEEGLAVVRAIHDRYHASRRNPWNEVECGDHYARAMASYGLFLAACGYEYHGPKGYLAFAPRLTPDNFRAAFTAAEGWGTFSQKAEGGRRKAEVAVKWGKVRLKTLALALPEDVVPTSVSVTLDDKPLPGKHSVRQGRITVTLAEDAVLAAGQTMRVHIG
ncbi:MAG: GH116 family glycosyl-hydrolase [Thermoguttaceae bacterium]|jgi:uncharacterized protein (DUF608 family)